MAAASGRIHAALIGAPQSAAKLFILSDLTILVFALRSESTSPVNGSTQRRRLGRAVLQVCASSRSARLFRRPAFGIAFGSDHIQDSARENACARIGIGSIALKPRILVSPDRAFENAFLSTLICAGVRMLISSFFIFSHVGSTASSALYPGSRRDDEARRRQQRLPSASDHLVE